MTLVVDAAPQQAGHYGDVVAAETGGADLYHDFVRTGFGRLDFADLELRFGARLFNEERLQSATPRAGSGRYSAVALMMSASGRSLSISSGLSSANGVDARRR